MRAFMTKLMRKPGTIGTCGSRCASIAHRHRCRPSADNSSPQWVGEARELGMLVCHQMRRQHRAPAPLPHVYAQQQALFST